MNLSHKCSQSCHPERKGGDITPFSSPRKRGDKGGSDKDKNIAPVLKNVVTGYSHSYLKPEQS